MHPRTLARAAGLLITLAPAVALAGEACCERLRLEALDMLQGDASAPRIAGFDAASGRDTANYPRSRDVDLLHMRLELTIPDMARPHAQGVQTLRLRTFPRETPTLTLDARNLTVRAVTTPSGAASFTQDPHNLTITFDPPLRRNAEHEVIITYDLRDPPRGMIWTLPQQGTTGIDAQLHTQGQPQTNSYWFPIFDFPSERLTTELIVLVPEGFTASSNGRLVSQSRVLRERPVAGAPPRIVPMERFHWLQAQDHAPYLVSLVVGDFDVVDVSDSPSLPMPVYAPRGRAEDARRTYSNTAPMLRLFERLLDEPYPFDRYAQLIVRNFEAGGMENTAATTMHENAVFSASADLDHDLDPLIAHELAHQWFGDLITCNSWEHIWLNEGFATYLEALWLEERDGPEGYLRDMLENIDRVLDADRGVAPSTPGMASKVYRHPWETFRRGANPYPKGASVLHMLRERLGDEVFFRALRTYIDRFRNQTVETGDFRRVVEEVSGLQLETFFEQWTARPGLPELDVTLEYQPDRRRLIFRIQQTQTIDADNSAFAFTLPIFIKNTQGPDVLIEPVIDQRATAFQVELEGPPAFVAVAPRSEVVARVTTRQSPRQWTQQLTGAPTLISRVHAARALRDAADAESAEALRQAVLDNSANVALRVSAVRALAHRKDVGAIRSLISAVRDPWEVRLALVEALASFTQDDTLKADQDLREFSQRLFTARLTDDPSLRVRNASLWGLTRMRHPQAPALLARALTVSSHADLTRQTALSALAWLKPEGALETIIPYASPGAPSRTRVEAIQAITALAQQDKDRAFAAIEAQLATRENQPRMAAAAALVALKDPRGIDALNKAIQATRASELVSRLEDHKAALERALQGS